MAYFTSAYEYLTLSVTYDQDFVLHVQLDRPKSLNAMNEWFWYEIDDCFRRIKDDKDCRVVVISGAGRMFSSGLDFTGMLDLPSKVMDKEDISRKAKYFQSIVGRCKSAFQVIDDCQKPVIAAVHGGCIGQGANLICACDMRYCTHDAYFSIKEIDIDLAAKIGKFQRYPKAVETGLLREYIYCCEKIDAKDAKKIGFVSKIFGSKDSMMNAAMHAASIVASKPPDEVQHAKALKVRMLQMEDVLKGAEETVCIKNPKFSKF